MNRTALSRIVLAISLLVGMAGSAMAQQIGPDPALAPEDVVSIQLTALQNNDDPAPNAGIAQTFALAHPDNKRLTGPLARFEIMIRSPAYRPLLDHRAHQIERVDTADTYVRFRVTVETQAGKALQYLWEVRPVASGEHEGAWLTTNVSAPVDGGQAL